ncbi:hypothetical protein [Prosthecobacter sp.]|uniref:hypothetical protein n=1 Tax=Prosthecobacter sp. TaxID=1965333 RepID=UPI003783584F
MKSSRIRSKTRVPGSTSFHSSFSDVHQHLDDSSPLFDELMQNLPWVPEQKTGLPQQHQAKVLFQFFDGWPAMES